jgi:hypothetical protein
MAIASEWTIVNNHPNKLPVKSLALLSTVFVLGIITFNAPGQTTVLSEDFEGAFPGAWSVGDANPSGTTAYWGAVDISTFGTPDLRPSGTFVGYCAAVGHAGGSGNPSYQNSMDAFMSQTFDLTGFPFATLKFSYAIPSLGAGDKCYVYVDGNLVWQATSAVGTTAWKDAAVDLSAYAGGVHTLKFEFISDTSGTAEGWYLDDIAVIGSNGLTINPIFDSTILNDPNSATIQSTINQAIQVYQSKFSDSITVTIKFAEMGGGLGQSVTYQADIAYTDFLNALIADAKTGTDTVALAHLPAGPNNPVSGDPSVQLTTANCRAIGIEVDPPPGEADSTIYLNVSIMNLDRITINPSKYDLMAVAMHEIDEALSFTSALDGLNNGDPPPTGPVSVMDLFRYDGSGNRSFNTASATVAYFSLDGTTDLARYNQTSSGDFQDWFSTGAHTPQVQDAFGTPGATPNLGVELVVLDASGYDLITPVSAPVFQSVSKTGTVALLSWSSVSGKNYQLQYKTNLTQSSWINLGSPILASNVTTIASDSTATNSQRFYRVGLISGSPDVRTRTQAQKLPVAPLTLKTNYLHQFGP